MQGDDKRPVSINAAQGKRIANAVKAVEGSYTANQRRGKVVAWNPGVVRAVVTTDIPTATFSSIDNSGRAQIYHLDNTRSAWKASGDPVVVNNDHVLTSTIAAGKTVKLCWCDGLWFLLAADC